MRPLTTSNRIWQPQTEYDNESFMLLEEELTGKIACPITSQTKDPINRFWWNFLEVSANGSSVGAEIKTQTQRVCQLWRNDSTGFSAYTKQQGFCLCWGLLQQESPRYWKQNCNWSVFIFLFPREMPIIVRPLIYFWECSALRFFFVNQENELQ